MKKKEEKIEEVVLEVEEQIEQPVEEVETEEFDATANEKDKGELE
jgi:hypothetical protein